MDRKHIAQKLARELAGEDKDEKAHRLLMSYSGFKLWHKILGLLEDDLERAKRDEEGLVKSGAGYTEARELLRAPLGRLNMLIDDMQSLAKTMESALR